jgi:hypothetical protein
MPSWAGTGMVMICMLTLRSRSTIGTSSVIPGPRVPSRTRPNRKMTPRSYWVMIRTLVPSPAARMPATTSNVYRMFTACSFAAPGFP